jgi:hypothetical protein
METVLIVLVVLFLLGGGGWGYSRWRGWRDHTKRMTMLPESLLEVLVATKIAPLAG